MRDIVYVSLIELRPGGSLLRLKRLRDITSWMALGSSILLFGFDWYCRSHYWRINEQGVGETTTPLAAGRAWALLVTSTLLLTIISALRWQSFIGTLVIGWVILVTVQGHWP
jgi:hypothetical protein